MEVTKLTKLRNNTTRWLFSLADLLEVKNLEKTNALLKSKDRVGHVLTCLWELMIDDKIKLSHRKHNYFPIKSVVSCCCACARGHVK